MDLVSFLTVVSVRSLILVAVVAILTVRVKSPAARHALWTVVTAGMLAIAVASATLPAVRVPVPLATVVPASFPVLVTRASRPASLVPFPWISALYLAGLLLFTARLTYAYHLTRRLVRTSTPTSHPAVQESGHIAVPLTIGSKILLPADWHTWPPENLEAVLVHERNHVLRADWAIAVVAGINRCVFWFHPLSWWLESRLKVLAELACDDASLPHVASRECYAQVLLEMAAAVREGKGRVEWGAVAMARTAEVGMRVERILDENRPIFPAMTRRRWSVMALLAVPVIYLASVTSPAQESTPAQYFVQGEVARAGAYKFSAPTEVLLALVNAGGFRDSANKSDIVIIRWQDGVSSRMHFNYNEVIRGTNPGQNIFLKPGDIIVVR